MSTLDCLVSVETSIASAIADTKPLNERQRQIKARYDTALAYLTEEDPLHKGQTRVQTYVAKQTQWNKEAEKYSDAQLKVKQENRAANMTVERQQQAFLEWMQAHGREYKAAIQAKYMDWVVHGYKFNVEFYFGVVDVSSAMKRIETSKEAYRNLTLLDDDGASEYAGVNLTPQNWATLVKRTIDDWARINKGPSPLDVRAEIKRLTSLKLSHQALLLSVHEDTFMPHVYSEAAGTGDEAYKAALRKKYDDINTAEANKQTKVEEEKDPVTGTPKLGILGSIASGAVDLRKEYFNDTIKAHEAWNKNQISQNATVLRVNNAAVKKETESYLNNRIATLNVEIKQLEAILGVAQPDAPFAGKSKAIMPLVRDEKGNTVEAADLKANVELKTDPDLSTQPSPWTRITAKVAKSESQSEKFSSESSTRGSADVGWWFWSSSASGGHSESSMKAQTDLSNLTIEISMDCMLVEIERPWMHAELFADHELDAAPGFKISPGPQALQKAAITNTPVATDYTLFSSYPNAFVIACNVELEFSGDTSSLQSSMEASSTEGNASIGIGPFSISAAHKNSKTSSKTKAESTATGMRISMQAPQIIAWVQELLPALPKPGGDNPALYGLPLNTPPDPFGLIKRAEDEKNAKAEAERQKPLSGGTPLPNGNSNNSTSG